MALKKVSFIGKFSKHFFSEDIFLKNCMLNLSKFPVVSFYSMTYPLEPYLCQSKT